MSPENIAPEPEPTAPPRPPSPPRFDVEPYRPDGAVGFGGLMLLMGGVFAAAVGLGLALSLVWQYFYLPFVFAILAGCILGGIARALVRAGRVRNAAVAGAVAALGAVGMMFFMHCFNCMSELGWRILPPARVFFLYIDLEAQAGVVFGEVGGNNGGVNLGYVGSYLFFAAETVLAAGFAFGLARGPALAPFCRGCNTWKKPRTLAGLPYMRPQAAAEAVQHGALLDLLWTGVPLGRGSNLFLKIFACPHCGPESPVVGAAELITTDSRGRRIEKLLCQTVYPGDVLMHLDAHTPWLAPAAPPAGAAEPPPEPAREDVRPAE